MLKKVLSFVLSCVMLLSMTAMAGAESSGEKTLYYPSYLQESEGETLVLLTRRFSRLPVIAGRTYVQPSQPIPVAAWDYTNVGAVQSTFDLGRRDAERFCAACRVSG